MTPSNREQIILAVIDALKNGGQAPCSVVRNPSEALADVPALCVYPVDEQGTPRGHTIVEKTLTVRVEAVIAGPSPAAELLDPLLNFAVQVIYASDIVRAFLIQDIAESLVNFDEESKDRDYARAAVDFTLVYFQTRGNP
jgi:hypothetical protein